MNFLNFVHLQILQTNLGQTAILPRPDGKSLPVDDLTRRFSGKDVFKKMLVRGSYFLRLGSNRHIPQKKNNIGNYVKSHYFGFDLCAGIPCTNSKG